jgi:hypothetical protein
MGSICNGRYTIPRVAQDLILSYSKEDWKPEYSTRLWYQNLLLGGNVCIRWGTYVHPLDAYTWLYTYPICETPWQKRVPQSDHFWVHFKVFEMSIITLSEGNKYTYEIRKLSIKVRSTRILPNLYGFYIIIDNYIPSGTGSTPGVKPCLTRGLPPRNPFPEDV